MSGSFTMAKAMFGPDVIVAPARCAGCAAVAVIVPTRPMDRFTVHASGCQARPGKHLARH